MKESNMSINIIKLFVIALLVFIITDMFWLGLIAKNLYQEQYAQWLRIENGQIKPLWWAAVIVYLLFALSVVVFIIPLAQNSVISAAVYGAVLGAVIYGIYDFTCLSIFKDFPVGIAFIDWAWGTVLCAWSGAITTYAARFMN
jgi:uncharacterized membrane protein